MTISVRLSDEENSDLSAYRKAMEDYNRNPESYSHEEVKKMLGLIDNQLFDSNFSAIRR